jgi:hypothetical protein
MWDFGRIPNIFGHFYSRNHISKQKRLLKLKLNPEGQGRQPPTDQPQQPATSRSRQPPPRLQPPAAFTLEG